MVMKSSKNYYEILGLTPDSDSGELKSAYRRLARKYHPDLNKDNPNAADKRPTKHYLTKKNVYNMIL